MLAMQYTVHLPHDFTANAIRERVEKRRELFDTLPGMRHKAFLFDEQDHIYAPFYIWENLPSARQFLLDDLFKGVVKSFSRPRVRDWMVLDSVLGDTSIKPTFCMQESDAIPLEKNLQELQAEQAKLQKKLSQDPNLYMHAVAIDYDRWELMHYSLWRDKKSAPRSSHDRVQCFDVLHISEPR